MRNKRSTELGILSLLFLLLFILNINVLHSWKGTMNEINMENEILETPLTVKSAGYWNNFSFIHIFGNWSTAAGYDWCSGDGSWGNPYTIENITMDASSSPTGIGIYIQNSKNDYFIIRNVTVYSAPNVGPFDSGITLENTNNGILTNNNFSENDYFGIVLVIDCDNNTISGNIVNNNMDGVFISANCKNNTISGNNASYNTYSGISLWNCDNNTISGNNVTDNNDGIYLYNCDNNTISGNNASYNTQNGIEVDCYSKNNSISGNNASYNTQCGIFLEEGSNKNTISGNTAKRNGGAIYLGGGCDDNTISGNTANNNNNYGISLLSSCNDNKILQNNVSDQIGGIYLNSDCYRTTISGNNISSNTQCGIWFGFYCSDTKILGNDITNNTQKGIFIPSSSDNFKISGNNISYNGEDGIWSDSFNHTIEKNEINYNGWNGIHIEDYASHDIFDNNITYNGQAGAYNGINLYNCGSNNITGNRITNNNDSGIGIISDNNQIIGNNISSNVQYGISIAWGCDNNSLYNNIFKNNTVNARDDAGTNFWNSSTIGNYWDNYTGFDVDRDGIGDTPHIIPGIIDYLPIWSISNSNVSIDLPVNYTLWGTPPPLKIRTFHPSNHSNWYNVSGNPNIAFLQNNTQENMDINLWNSLPEGQFQISFYFNDTSGVIYETATYTLYKDSEAPNMVLSFPSDGEYYRTAPPSYNVQVSDVYPFTMWYSFNNLLNITFTNNGTLDLGNWTTLPDGLVTLRFYSKDTAGNLQTTTLNIHKDTKKPSITISAPEELQVFVDQVPEFDITVKDASPCKIWYSLNDGKNISCSESGSIKAKEWNAISDGVIRIKFYVQDAAGNLDSIEIDVQKTTSNWLLIIIIIIAVAIAMLGVGLFARRSRIKTKVRDAKIVAFLDQQKSAITENDISIFKEQHICLVHKGKIDGISYICPGCGSFYCMKCYEALIELENECWSCRSSIDVSKPVKSFDKYKSAASIDDGKGKKGLMKSTEIARKADLKRASLMAANAPKLREPIKKTSSKPPSEIDQLKQKIDYVKRKIDDLDFSAEIGIITEEKYLRKRESLEAILNLLNSKLDQIKK